MMCASGDSPFAAASAAVETWLAAAIDQSVSPGWMVRLTLAAAGAQMASVQPTEAISIVLTVK